MNIVQMHMGNKISDKRIEMMKANINLLDENDVYYLVAENNFFKNDKRVKFKNINTVIKNMFVEYPNIKTLYPLLTITSNKCNFIRFYLATKMDEYLYIDTDCVLKERIIFDKSKVYFPIFKYDSLDFFLFYTNIDFSKRCIKYMSDTLVQYRRIRTNLFFTFFNQFIHQEKHEIINKDLFLHTRGI